MVRAGWRASYLFLLIGLFAAAACGAHDPSEKADVDAGMPGPTDGGPSIDASADADIGDGATDAGRPDDVGPDVLSGFHSGRFVDIDAGRVNACAVTEDGVVECWGANFSGQNDVPVGLADVVEVSTSYGHSCARTAQGDVVCWGRTQEGQTAVPADLPTATSIETAPARSCAIVEGGARWCWGSDVAINDSGVVKQTAADLYTTCDLYADGSLECINAVVPGGLASVEAIALRDSLICAVFSDGTLGCWNRSGAIQPTPAIAERIKTVTVGDNNVCVTLVDDTFSCWGRNEAGQLNRPSSVPAAVDQVSLGMAHTCVRTADGATCWGKPYVARPVPSSGAVAVLAGAGFSCATDMKGALSCWGNNSYGQSEPPTGEFVAMDGIYHACAIDSVGGVTCWGSNTYGQNDVPLGLGAITQIAVSRDTSCAIDDVGAVTCWGRYPLDASAAATIGALKRVRGSLPGFCGVRANGSAVCWERGVVSPEPSDSGPFVGLALDALGLVCAEREDATHSCWDTGNPAAPIVAPTLDGLTEVVSGGVKWCGLNAMGKVDCGGAAYPGLADLPAPQAFDAGWNHGCLVDGTGAVHCWGSNDTGQAGSAL